MARVAGALCVEHWLELGYGQSVVVRDATRDGPAAGIEIPVTEGPGDSLLSAVTTVDVDGDGVRDVVVRDTYGGAALLDETVSLTIFRGADLPFEDRERLRFVGDTRVPAGGDIASLGDWDGDARADLIAGWDGSVILTGSSMTEGSGPCLRGAAIGDVNGDGVEDSACVAPDASLEIVLGGAGRDAAPHAEIFRDAPISAITRAGDVNGDGRGDFVIVLETGASEVLSGADPEGVPLATATSGYSWTALSDVDGDGLADLVARRSHGAFLVRGARAGLDVEGEEIVSIGDTPRSVVSAGDADCDGLADVLVITRGTVELRRGTPAGIEEAPLWSTSSERRSLVPIFD